MPLGSWEESNGSWQLTKVRSALSMRVHWQPLQSVEVKHVEIIISAWRPDLVSKSAEGEHHSKLAEEREGRPFYCRVSKWAHACRSSHNGIRCVCERPNFFGGQ